jgi:FAD/FMN-containing dehydrogenase/Fe-S oxidoreductase
MPSIQKLQILSKEIEGELYFDDLHKSMFATDASVYREIPLAVSFPKTEEDIQKLIKFTQNNGINLIPRTAGTSLAGQCVGKGIIVDVSKHFTKILAFDEKNQTVKVEPGVIRDDLNLFLKPFGMFFGPNTSTSNRCMIGGMVGNNSSGTTSIKYGVTRDKVISMNTILSDGSKVNFKALDKNEVLEKMKGNSLEQKIYSVLHTELSKPETQSEIRKGYPKKSIHRRNTGYAVDSLIDTQVFSSSDEKLNLSKLLCGSEGTLAFTTDITIHLDELQPRENILIAVHFNSIQESLKATVVAMNHNLYTCELMDKTILDCTKNNREQNKNRFFIKGDPGAILMLEVAGNTRAEVESQSNKLISDLKNKSHGYHYPELMGEDIAKAFNLRKAGLGLLGNIVGDKKAVACIEDTAVDVKDLPDYIGEFSAMMEKHEQNAVYYAHAGAGEIHLRPILNLKQKKDVELFRTITSDVTDLVKKYKGSLSGEHGDGIVRSEFIPKILGESNYELLKKIKYTFDPNNIFNKGKIVDPLPMDKSLRYEVDRKEPEIDTIFDFSDSLGVLRATEKCNGSGDCRKPVSAGGTMCPSYRATKNEKDTTRARANTLREFLTNSNKSNRFNHEELKEVFDLCLSCKACASECPSNVDVASLKAEFLHQYYKDNGIPFRTRLFANNVKLNKLGSITPRFTNLVINSIIAKKIMGIAPKRTVPKLVNKTVRQWYRTNKFRLDVTDYTKGGVHLFIDEFTNYFDAQAGIDTIEVLTSLGYKVFISNHKESGRSFISKGVLDKAKELADFNVSHYENLVTEETPLIGVEPSAILSFRDEYIRLADNKKAASDIAKNTYTIEEFFQKEINLGNITSDQFTTIEKTVKIHGHCQQKSLSNISASFDMLNIPQNFNVTIINSGCCGMAGSFGYEKEHYKLSMQIGEDTLFPKIRNSETQVVIAAAGTSCRHQIQDGTNRDSHHPISILRQVLK